MKTIYSIKMRKSGAKNFYSEGPSYDMDILIKTNPHAYSRACTHIYSNNRVSHNL